MFALLSGAVNDRFGRRPTVIVSSVVFAGAAVWLGAAQQRWELMVGRAVLGIGIGKFVHLSTDPYNV